MQLLYSHASPYARTCRVMAREKGLMHELTELEANPLDNPPALTTRNPLGKIPCLFLADHSELFDSAVINEYLNEHGHGPNLFAAYEGNWALKKWQALSQGMLDVAVQLRIEKTKPETQQSALWMARNRDALCRSVDMLEKEKPMTLAPDSFLPLHLACTLGYLDFRHQEIDWKAHAPYMADWYKEMEQRPSLFATRPI